MYSVKAIHRDIAKQVVETKHYSHRLGIMWESFGLYDDETLVGVICYGQPSAPIQKHSFKNREFRLYELTRLVVDEGIPNGASILISKSLRLLSSQPCAVVSYADSAYGHCGIVYQATNWIYTGATKAHDSLYLVNGEKLHSMTIASRFGVTDQGRWAKENGIERIKPELKHRYFTFVGDRRQVKAMRGKLAYPSVSDYPKNEKKTYASNGRCRDFSFRETAPMF